MSIENYFQLGIVYKDKKVISHRSLVKIFFNPLLRILFNRAIGSVVIDGRFIKYGFIKQKYPKYWTFKIDFKYDYIKRIK